MSDRVAWYEVSTSYNFPSETHNHLDCRETLEQILGTGVLTHDVRIEMDADHSVQNFVNFGHHWLRYLWDGVRPYASLIRQKTNGMAHSNIVKHT